MTRLRGHTVRAEPVEAGAAFDTRRTNSSCRAASA